MDMTMTQCAFFHGIALFMLLGFIWLVQLVVYPQFANVSQDGWHTYHQAHCRNITWIAAPLMTLELFTAALLLAWVSVGTDEQGLMGLLWVNMALIGVVWLSTALVQVPLHRKLEVVAEDDERFRLIQQLVVGNWIRTLAWSVRAVGVTWAVIAPM